MALPIRTIDSPRFYTAEEFMTMSLDPATRHELVRGVIKERSHPGEEYGLVHGNLSFAVNSYARTTWHGRMFPPGSFQLSIPGEVRDSIRSPDAAYLSKDKLSGQSGSIKFGPDLAVEIYSSNDRAGQYREKFEDYRAAGWNLVWLIYPPKSSPKRKAGKVEVYRLQQSLEPVRTLSINDDLAGEEAIAGFTMKISALFDYEV